MLSLLKICFSFNVSCIIPRVCLPPDIQLQPLLNCLWWLVIWIKWKRPVSILLLKRESFRECTWMALYDANRISVKKRFSWRLSSWNQGYKRDIKPANMWFKIRYVKKKVYMRKHTVVLNDSYLSSLFVSLSVHPSGGYPGFHIQCRTRSITTPPPLDGMLVHHKITPLPPPCLYSFTLQGKERHCGSKSVLLKNKTHWPS